MSMNLLKLTRGTTLIGLLITSTGCGTMMQGTSQVITFNLEPKTTTCDLTTKGRALGSVSTNVPQIELGKSKHDVLVRCSAPGFQDYQTLLPSEASAGGVGSVFLFDFGITDLATGAFWKYPETVTVSLRKEA